MADSSSAASVVFRSGCFLEALRHKVSLLRLAAVLPSRPSMMGSLSGHSSRWTRPMSADLVDRPDGAKLVNRIDAGHVAYSVQTNMQIPALALKMLLSVSRIRASSKRTRKLSGQVPLTRPICRKIPCPELWSLFFRSYARPAVRELESSLNGRKQQDTLAPLCMSPICWVGNCGMHPCEKTAAGF